MCTKAVSDNADGGEYCTEPVMPSLDYTCHDHAHVCQGPPPPDPDNDEPWRHDCGEPTEHNKIFCPEHLALGDEGQPTNES